MLLFAKRPCGIFDLGFLLTATLFFSPQDEQIIRVVVLPTPYTTYHF